MNNQQFNDITDNIKRLERQNTEILHKQERILEKIALINGSLNTLFEDIKNINVAYERLKHHGITEEDLKNNMKAYKEGFEAGLRIKNFEPGKEIDRDIYNMMKKGFYSGIL